jgi:hypothetical protein
MSVMHRRSFVQRLGLGVGATVLGPLVSGLVREAQGQVTKRRRLLMLLDGNGFDYKRCFVPSGLDAQANGNAYFETKSFSLPPAMAALAPYRNRMLAIGGAANQQGPGFSSGHMKGFLATTCVPLLGSAPGGPSIDAVIGRALIAQNPYATVNLGAGPYTPGMVFSTAPGQSVRSITSPAQAVSSLFAPLSGDAGAAALLNKRRRLVDLLSQDIKRVQANLAGREKLKLDQYLSALEDIGTRVSKLEGIKGCTAPTPGAGDGLEATLAAHVDIAAAALICGLTQVATVASAGTGNTWPTLTGTRDSHDMGHDNTATGVGQRAKIHNYHAELITRFCKRLETVSEGNGTTFDNTIAFWTNHNAEGHHSKGNHYPLVIVGTGGAFIKADGRFIKFAARGQSGFHSLGDVYCTIAHAMGAPNDTFGKGGNEPVTGPIKEIT